MQQQEKQLAQAHAMQQQQNPGHGMYAQFTQQQHQSFPSMLSMHGALHTGHASSSSSSAHGYNNHSGYADSSQASAYAPKASANHNKPSKHLRVQSFTLEGHGLADDGRQPHAPFQNVVGDIGSSGGEQSRFILKKKRGSGQYGQRSNLRTPQQLHSQHYTNTGRSGMVGGSSHVRAARSVPAQSGYSHQLQQLGQMQQLQRQYNSLSGQQQGGSTLQQPSVSYSTRFREDSKQGSSSLNSASLNAANVSRYRINNTRRSDNTRTSANMHSNARTRYR
jgi:hypothetical protein